MVRKWWPFTCFILFVLMLTPDISGQQRTGQFEVGGHFGLLFDSDKVADKKIVLPEFGGTLTYFFSKRLGLEAVRKSKFKKMARETQRASCAYSCSMSASSALLPRVKCPIILSPP
jgi:hypothetical protein